MTNEEVKVDHVKEFSENYGTLTALLDHQEKTKHGASEVRDASVAAIEKAVVEGMARMEGFDKKKYEAASEEVKQEMRNQVYSTILTNLKTKASNQYRGHASDITDRAITAKSLEGILGNETGRGLVVSNTDDNGKKDITAYDLVNLVSTYSPGMDKEKRTIVISQAIEKYADQAVKNEEARQVAKYGKVIHKSEVEMARSIATVVMGAGMVNDDTVKKYAIMQLGYKNADGNYKQAVKDAASVTQDKAIKVTRKAFNTLGKSTDPKTFDTAQNIVYTALKKAA